MTFKLDRWEMLYLTALCLTAFVGVVFNHRGLTAIGVCSLTGVLLIIFLRARQ